MRFVPDDGGRLAAGFRGAAGDCVTRAVAIATERDYREVYDDLQAMQQGLADARGEKRHSVRRGVGRSTYDWYLGDALGWRWTPTMGIGTGCRVHLRDGELPAGRLIARLTRHMCAVIDGVIHDTHDPSRDGTRCVYGIWQPPEAPEWDPDILACGCPRQHVRDFGRHQEGCDYATM